MSLKPAPIAVKNWWILDEPLEGFITQLIDLVDANPDKKLLIRLEGGDYYEDTGLANGYVEVYYE